MIFLRECSRSSANYFMKFELSDNELTHSSTGEFGIRVCSYVLSGYLHLRAVMHPRSSVIRNKYVLALVDFII